MIKERLAELAERLGYHVVPKWRLKSFPLAHHLQRLFQQLRIDCVLDVGANRGQYRDFLRKEVGYSGPVVSFEPNVELASALTERTQIDRSWRVHNCALGASCGYVELKIMAQDDFSSILSPDSTGLHLDGNTVIRTARIQMKRLDSIDISAKRIYLKADTQGYDLEVIRGASGYLDRVVALQVEASVRAIYQGMPDYVSAIREIEGLGYCLSGVFGNNDAGFPKLVEFDAVFVRT